MDERADRFRPTAPTVPKDSSWEAFLAASTGEKVAAVEGYYAYFGTWTLDPSNSTVTHHIKQSLRPGERGEEASPAFCSGWRSPDPDRKNA